LEQPCRTYVIVHPEKGDQQQVLYVVDSAKGALRWRTAFQCGSEEPKRMQFCDLITEKANVSNGKDHVELVEMLFLRW